MKVSLNSIRYYQKLDGRLDDPAPDGVEALVQKIGAQLAGIDEVVTYGERFNSVVVAKVVSCEDHPDADRLHVCKIDDGGRTEGVDRDENGYVQVVCGAPNVREGIKVAWLPPGTTVPNTLDKDPFVLEARALRGVVSNGMLASAKELTIGDNHEGLLELDTDAEPGTSFNQAYDLEGDVIIEMENKMFTHRPDCFGLLGVAREIAGIQGQTYKSPEWYRLDAEVPERETDELKLEVQNELHDLVPRFTAITMRDVTIKQSPVWLQIYLSKLGVRPINNIVDFTNFLMLETGQPLHAYDYDKVVAQDSGASHATIVVRYPKEGEKILLLNGKEVQPRPEAIMIATRDKLIGIGGVMGGGDTEVDENTHNIIIEAANFDMYSIRRSAMTHGLFTDAVTRFNKGQSPLQTRAVLARIVYEIRTHADGKVASALIDDNHLPDDMQARGSVHPPVTVSRDFINTRLGLDLSSEEIARLLTNVEFRVGVNDDNLMVTAPFWRTDIAIPEDVVEEAGRLYGYDHLPLELPKRDLTPVQKAPMLDLKARISNALAAAGANEVLTYSFVHGNLLQKIGQDSSEAFQLSNALSPDLQYYRLSILPSLLEKVHPNSKAGYDQFALFELGKAHNVKEPDGDGLPREVNALGLVVTASEKVAQASIEGAPYYQARAYLLELLERFGAGEFVQLVPLAAADLYENPWLIQMSKPFEPGRSAVLRAAGGLVWGIVGEFKSSVHRSLKLPAYTAGFELDPLLLARPNGGKQYVKLPRFPKVEQDICLKVPADKTYAEVYDFVWSALSGVQPDNTLPSLHPVDIYQRQDDPAHKQVTLRYSLASYERTLTDEEISKLLEQVASRAADKLQAERI